MIRRLCGLVAFLSLALCIAAAVLWARSVSAADEFYVRSQGKGTIQLWSVPGLLMFNYMPPRFGTSGWGLTFDYQRVATAALGPKPFGSYFLRENWGVVQFIGQPPYPPTQFWVRSKLTMDWTVIVRFWFVVAIFAVLPVLWAIAAVGRTFRRWRRRRRILSPVRWLIAVGSLASFVIVTSLWVASYRFPVGLTLFTITANNASWRAFIDPGRIGIDDETEIALEYQLGEPKLWEMSAGIKRAKVQLMLIPPTASDPQSVALRNQLNLQVKWLSLTRSSFLGRRVAGRSISYRLPFAVTATLLAVMTFVAGRNGRRLNRKGYCLACGYNLTGNASGICPECGASTSAGLDELADSAARDLRARTKKHVSFRRKLLRTAAALSLLLGIPASLVWRHSYRSTMQVPVPTAPGWRIVAEKGQLWADNEPLWRDMETLSFERLRAFGERSAEQFAGLNEGRLRVEREVARGRLTRQDWIAYVQIEQANKQHLMRVDAALLSDRPTRAMVMIHHAPELWKIVAACAVFPVFWLLSLVRWRRKAPGSCAACGYDLTGNISGVCPECGIRADSPFSTLPRRL